MEDESSEAQERSCPAASQAGGAASYQNAGYQSGESTAAQGYEAGTAVESDADAFDPVEEDRYWAATYSANSNLYRGDYKVFQPACRYGWESYQRYSGRRFEEVEPVLEAEWNKHRGDSGPNWGVAREAARGAWNRVERRAQRRS